MGVVKFRLKKTKEQEREKKRREKERYWSAHLQISMNDVFLMAVLDC